MEFGAIRQLIQRFPIFKELTTYEIEPIVDLAKKRLYHSGEHIFMHGDPLTNVYFIYEGSVKIYRTDSQGKEQIVNILKQPDMFPHQGFFRKDNYPAHAQAMSACKLVYIPIATFEDFLIAHPNISIKLFRVLGDIIVDLQSRLKAQMLNTSFEQIIMLLLRLSDSHGIIIDTNRTRIQTKFTNIELANMIGTSRETVNRALSKLKQMNCIAIDDDGYMIVYPDMLTAELSDL